MYIGGSCHDELVRHAECFNVQCGWFCCSNQTVRKPHFFSDKTEKLERWRYISIFYLSEFFLTFLTLFFELKKNNFEMMCSVFFPSDLQDIWTRFFEKFEWRIQMMWINLFSFSEIELSQWLMGINSLWKYEGIIRCF